MREYFIVTLDGEIVRRGAVPEGKAQAHPLADGEELQIVTREEYRDSQERTQR